jgi:hypothetical protein
MGRAGCQGRRSAQRPRPNTLGLRSGSERPKVDADVSAERGHRLCLKSPQQHQKPLKFSVVAVAFPKIDELADDLEVCCFIVACAVDRIDLVKLEAAMVQR